MIYQGPLGAINWKELFENNTGPENMPDINKLANLHLANFYSQYNIIPDFKLEHKLIFKKGAYVKKAHYSFLTYEEDKTKPNAFTYSKRITKMRGFKQIDNGLPIDPLYLLLESVINGNERNFKVQNNGIYYKQKLLKVTSWLLSLNLKTEKTQVKQSPDGIPILLPASSNSSNHLSFGKNILPGDSYIVQAEFRMNNKSFPIYSFEEYSRKNRRGFRNNKFQYIYGNIISKKQELFEKYILSYDLYCMYDRMALDKLKWAVAE